jgi:hypothetical protein
VNVISHFIVAIYLVMCITVYCLSHFMHLVVVCKNVGELLLNVCKGI